MIKSGEKIYCEYAEYIDECFICKLSGESCDLGLLPSRYECSRYCREGYRLRTRSKLNCTSKKGD